MVARSEFNFHWSFRVRYSEIDGQRVVFNAHYLTYFDTAITEYFRALPYDYIGQIERTGEDFHTVKTVVEYKQPIGFDDDIEVYVRMAHIGRSSLTFALEIYLKNHETMKACGEVVWVNTCQRTHTSAALPQELIDKVKAFESFSATT